MGREYAPFPSDGALPHMDFYSLFGLIKIMNIYLIRNLAY